MGSKNIGRSRRVPLLMTVTELRRKTRAIVQQVSKEGTPVFLSLNGKLIAEVVPVEDPGHLLNSQLTNNHSPKATKGFSNV